MSRERFRQVIRTAFVQTETGQRWARAHGVSVGSAEVGTLEDRPAWDLERAREDWEKEKDARAHTTYLWVKEKEREREREKQRERELERLECEATSVADSVEFDG